MFKISQSQSISIKKVGFFLNKVDFIFRIFNYYMVNKNDADSIKS